METTFQLLKLWHWRVALLALMAVGPQMALAQTADDEMAMRWWNTLDAEQMVAALHGDAATAEQEAAAKKMYAGLSNLTKKLVNDAADELYGHGRFTSVGEWWETLDCRLMRVAAGDGNAADPMSPYCAHYPGSGAAKILGDVYKESVDEVGMALLGRDDPGTLLSPAEAMATRWWNSLNPEQMVAALFGDMAAADEEAAAKKMYADLDADTKMLVDDAAAEIYGDGHHASVGAWWETLDCRLMRVAAGDGSMADPMSAFCAHYPGSGNAKILGDMEKAFVDQVGMALLRRSNPGVFPTPHSAMAMRWWNTLNADQMVAALHGDSATTEQEMAAKNMYANLDDYTRMLVNYATADIYGNGPFMSVGAWWETLDCRKMRVAVGDGNAADPMSPYCAHYPGSGLDKILESMETDFVDSVGMALLGRESPGAYPDVHRLPFVPSTADMNMREGFLRVVNRGPRSVDVMIEAIDDGGMARGMATLTLGANEARQLNSYDLEMGNAMKGLSGGVGSGAGNWQVVLTSTLPLDALAYVRHADGFVTSMNGLVPYNMNGHQVVFINPASNTGQVSWLRIVNPGMMNAHVRIEGTDDAGAAPGSAVEFYVSPGAAMMVSAQHLEEGGNYGMMGALGDGMGKWRLQINSDQHLEVMSLLMSPAGHLTNLSAVSGQ